MKSTLYIPKTLQVGFQKRKDTYTGRLAYVVYVDHQGKLRKETSWQQWRDKKIDPESYENVPTEGFVLNKGVGGARESYGWNTRNEYIRVYDPRNFEFEISVSNLLFILREHTCHPGKGLEGEFVYAWEGNSLVLLPVKAAEYQSSVKYTALQGKKISAKELIPGAVYETKDLGLLTYLGRFERIRHENVKAQRARVHVFVNEAGHFQFPSGLSKLARCAREEPAENFAELVDKYHKSQHATPVKKLFIDPFTKEEIDRIMAAHKERRSRNNYHSDNFWIILCKAHLHSDAEALLIRIQCDYGYNHMTNNFREPQMVADKKSLVTLKEGILSANEFNSGFGAGRFPGARAALEGAGRLGAELESGVRFWINSGGWPAYGPVFYVMEEDQITRMRKQEHK